MTFSVPIIIRKELTFLVEADTPKEAGQLARQLYDDGDNGIDTGSEWEEFERIGDCGAIPLN